MNTFFIYLETVNTFIWGYLATFLILTIGVYLSFKARWMQIFQFHKIIKVFLTANKSEVTTCPTNRGTSPLQAFFASLGGCIGIGNLVTVAIAIQIGGPGALVWMWVVALLGMILKYTEIYLGITFRVPNHKNGYDGGPMYFLQKAFPKLRFLPACMAFMLAIYGVEIFIFSVVKDSLVTNWHLPSTGVMIGLLALILLGASGGVQRIGQISSILVPGFVLVFCLMTLWILWQHIEHIPTMMQEIVRSAFTGHAAMGGFLGSSFTLAIAKGFSAAAYSGDVGIGYASIIQSEARTKSASSQASLSIFGIFLDTFVVCTCTTLLIYATGVWAEPVDGEMMVQLALAQYFPYMHIFMPILLFCLGYSTILPYLVAGLKAARFISEKHGAKIYYTYSIFAFTFFSFYDTEYALTTMNVAGGLLMMINLPALLKLHHLVKYKATD